MSGFKHSLAYWCLNGPPWNWSLERICAAAQGLGCQSVELVPADLWPVLRSHSLTCAIAHNGMPGAPFVRGLNNPSYHEEIFTRTKLTIDQAADFDVPNVIAFTGFKWRDAEDPRSGEIPAAEGAAHCARGLAELGAYAGKRNVTICLEQLNTRDDSDPMKGHPGYQGDDIDYCAEIVKQSGSPHVKLLFDIYHVQIMNGDVIRRLRQYRDLIGHIHTAGNPGRGALDDSQEIHYPAIVRALAELDYRGFIGQEFIPTRDPEESLRQAVALCSAAQKVN
jgi:sugar phosphate isomerase/epimerase